MDGKFRVSYFKTLNGKEALQGAVGGVDGPLGVRLYSPLALGVYGPGERLWKRCLGAERLLVCVAITCFSGENRGVSVKEL